jgi:hypothetical protein
VADLFVRAACVIEAGKRSLLKKDVPNIFAMPFFS